MGNNRHSENYYFIQSGHAAGNFAAYKLKHQLSLIEVQTLIMLLTCDVTELFVLSALLTEPLLIYRTEKSHTFYLQELLTTAALYSNSGGQTLLRCQPLNIVAHLNYKVLHPVARNINCK
jgi:hypothetical protein